MANKIFGAEYLKELEMEAPASRKCLERVPDNLFDWKPHEKSMKMGYLSLLVADIPKWITTMAKGEDIDFGTWERFEPLTNADLINRFDTNMKEARVLLQKITDEEMEKNFHLKNNGQLLMTTPIKDSISSSINHLVHHRGQLTVYLRLNNIPVPSIYGPSADDKSF